MTNLLILAAGGHASVVAETVLSSGLVHRIAFLDDRCACAGFSSTLFGWPVIGPLVLALETDIREKFPSAVVAIGNPVTRLRWIDKLSFHSYNLPSFVHPTAWVSPSAHVGMGSVVFAQAAIQARASIGQGVILNTGCSLDHDSQLADGVHICPGARLAGEVRVGMRSWIGIGASVIPQICIGADVTVGAGAAVVRDLPDGVTAVGVPARVLVRS